MERICFEDFRGLLSNRNMLGSLQAVYSNVMARLNKDPLLYLWQAMVPFHALGAELKAMSLPRFSTAKAHWFCFTGSLFLKDVSAKLHRLQDLRCLGKESEKSHFNDQDLMKIQQRIQTYSGLRLIVSD